MMHLGAVEVERSSRRRVDMRLKGGEDDGNDYQAEEEAAAVGDGVDDRVFVELAARGGQNKPSARLLGFGVDLA